MTIFFCIIIGIIFILPFFLIRFSTLKINIKEFLIENTQIKKLNIKISLNFLNKIKWIQLTINQKRINKLQNSNKKKIISKILKTKILKDYQNVNKILKDNYKQILKKFNEIQIEKFNLKTVIGTKEADKTAYANALVSIAIPILIARKAEKFSYKVKPIYIDKNYLFFSINCIISLKMVHIINIKKLMTQKNKRKEVYQNNGKTSNRRTYANSHG